jgi:hypothetical protein
MSLLSQFFPSGGGSKMHVELLAVSGGGGAGAGTDSNSNYIWYRPGGGGGGAAYQGRLSIEPGSTVPITIGAGGAGGASPTPCGGDRGGDTIVKYPEGVIRVAGGGGGLSGNEWGADPTIPGHGGTGGGGGCHNRRLEDCVWAEFASGPTQGIATGLAGRGSGRSIYSKGNAQIDVYQTCQPTVGCKFHIMQWNGTTMTPHGDGAFYGAPGNLSMVTNGSPISCQKIIPGSGGGGAGGQGFLSSCQPSNGCVAEVAGPGIFTEMTGTMEEFGRGGLNHIPTFPTPTLTGPANSGNGGSNLQGGNACAGGSGVVIIRYPTDFNAAPASPGATLCTPVTPGYHTYRFNSTGSITLP